MTEKEAKDLAAVLNQLIEKLGYYASVYMARRNKWSVEILENWPDAIPLPRK